MTEQKGSLRVLIVDDEAQMITAVKRLVMTWAKDHDFPSIETDLHFDGGSAWSAFIASGIDGHLYDLVISDNNMPVKTGIELLEHIRLAGSNVPFVLMSGKNVDSEVSDAAFAHKAAFIDKPFDLDAFRAILDQFFPAPIPAAVAPSSNVPIVLIPDPPTRKIAVIADDDPDIREALCTIVEGLGLTVLESSDGQQTLQLCAKHPVDVVLTDYQMERMDGVICLMQLRKAGLNMPCLVMSGRNDPDIIALIKSKNASFLPKPANLNMVRTWLTEKGLISKPTT